jgi:MFS transporter, Spinster family, sphingosine-1-phosphate transporter
VTASTSTSSTTKSDGAAPGAFYAVAVLTSLNLLNYIDRYVPSAVKDLFKKDLDLNDFQTSVPLTAFLWVYLIASPIFATIAERGSRTRMIAIGVALWSAATAAAAFATGFVGFLVARALVGVGEAAYATIAPALISDFYPPSRRNKIFTVFYVAIPVGAAIGFGVGSLVGAEWGWRAAFLVCGVPGIVAALLALRIDDPPRGRFDEGPKIAPPPWKDALPALLRNRRFVYTVAGYTAVTFATGGIADWFVAFVGRHRGMDLAEAGTTIGGVTILGGIVGTLLGGFLADKLKGRTKNPYLALSAISMAPATVLAVVALTAQSKLAIIVAIAGCQLFLWFYNAPVNAILVNCVGPEMRVRAFALSIFSIHVLGDAISPSIIGALSDATDGNLPLAISIVPVALGVACAIWAIAWRRLPDDGTS